MRNERGFTLIEMLSVLAIILAVLGLTGGSYVCVTKTMDKSEVQEDMRTISTLVTNYYTDRGEAPVLDVVTNVDESVIQVANEYIEQLDFSAVKVDIKDLIDSGEVYQINPAILSNNGDLTKEKLQNYYIIHLNKADQERYKGLDNTIISSRVVSTCQNEHLVMKKGTSIGGNATKAYEYDVPDTYIDCPNKDLCEKLLDDKDVKTTEGKPTPK